MAPPSPTPLVLGRFKQLAQRTSEVWQGGLVRLPTWIENPVDPDGPPFRPVGAVWVSLRTGRMNLQLPADGRTASTDLALACLLEFAATESKQLGGRPARIEVRDTALKDLLEVSLAGTGTDIVVLDDLPAVTAVRWATRRTQHDGRPRARFRGGGGPFLRDSPVAALDQR